MSRLAAKIVAVTNVSKGAWEDVDIIEEIKPLEFSEGKNSSITFDFGFDRSIVDENSVEICL